MSEQNIDKNKYMLVDTFLRKGHISDLQFGFNHAKKMKFINDNGLNELYQKYIDAGKEFDSAINQDEFKAAKQKVEDIAKDIRTACRKELEKQGLDITAIYGTEPDIDEKKKLLIEQLEQMGMSEEFIKNKHFDDIEKLINEGSQEFEYTVKDTPETRKRFEDEGIEYHAENGRLKVKATLHATEGVAFDDTPDNRKILDDNEIKYMRMAMNKNPYSQKTKLFVPSTWINPVRSSVASNFDNYFNKIINNQYGRSLLGGTMIAGTVATAAMMGLVIHPVFAVTAYLLLRKTGLFKARKTAFYPTAYEQRALQKGLTVYKEENGRGKYLYMHKGNLLSLDAKDIRIPEYIKGIKLTPLQRQQFRTGELIQLKGNDGETFSVRVDITSPNLIREYYKELKNDISVKPIPKITDSDEAKLSYIEHRGYKGVLDIFGKMSYNPRRDSFLKEYNLYNTFRNYEETNHTLRRTTDKDLRNAYTQYLKNDDGKLKDIARNELLSQINRTQSL